MYSIYKILAVVIAIWAVIQLGLVLFTSFTRTITIKDKEPYGFGRVVRNQVVDTNGNIYSVKNEVFLLHFRAAEVWMKLEEGKTYNIKGYGVSIPNLGAYPNITKIEESAVS